MSSSLNHYSPTIYKALRPDTQAQLHAIVSREASCLASTFYSYFLRSEDAAPFLSHDTVHQRLKSSMELWIKNIFDPQFSDIDEIAQKKIGKVHAHLGIPINLVLKGAILLKTELGTCLMQEMHDPLQLSDAILFSCNRIDKAMALMSASYISDTKKNVQEAEAYRAMSFGQNLATEREGQLVALMEWSQSFLFALITHENILPSLSGSALGLWLRHRAAILFGGTPQLVELTNKTTQFDQDFLSKAQIINSETQQAFTIRFQQAVDEIKSLLSDLFKNNDKTTEGVDPLTTLLNRRFLSAILSREISIAVHARMPLSVIVLNIDNFSEINKNLGSPAGDSAIKQVAEYLQKTTRPSDFLFRYNHEEFLLVLVEMNTEGAIQIGKRIKSDIQNKTFYTADLTSINIHLSIGVSSYDGHPDHNFLIKCAIENLKNDII
ncbi:MAG: GGDEF domain-containing protein [Acetobacter orientalis]|uniref:GGDEF domain-containing protein n=1 Tax=Acetobacter orientalis TaxID=146474 RepID=UPI0039E96267